MPRRLRDQWNSIGEEWEGGAPPSHFEFVFVSGCPIRSFVGGSGGSRLPRMSPSPISWSLWREASQLMVNLDGVQMDRVDQGYQDAENLAQPLRPPLRGGDLVAHAPRDGSEMRLMPMSSYERVRDAYALS